MHCEIPTEIVQEKNGNGANFIIMRKMVDFAILPKKFHFIVNSASHCFRKL